MLDLENTITEFGGDPSSLKFMDRPGPDLLAYATLTGPARQTDDYLSTIRAVYEWQGSPLVFLVDLEDLPKSPAHMDLLVQLRRFIAMQTHGAYLGVIAPGSLDIYPVDLDDRTSLDKIEVPQDDVHANSLIGQTNSLIGQTNSLIAQANSLILPWLANTRPGVNQSNQRWNPDISLGILIADAIKTISEVEGISHNDAVSLVGRALFIRVLADKFLLSENLVESVDFLHYNPKRFQIASERIDQVFNENLLPPDEKHPGVLTKQGQQILKHILGCASDKNIQSEGPAWWEELDFAHIPATSIAQAFDRCLHIHFPQDQKQKSGTGTPQSVVDLVVTAAFKGMENSGKTENASVLDPAAGSGVFLLAAFHKLVDAEWRETGIRPSTEKLHHILQEQITGFDIDETSLRLCALGLYLGLIEFDPDLRPVDQRVFPDLRNTALHLLPDDYGNISSSSEIACSSQTGRNISSSGNPESKVNEKYKNKYDIVIGHPPGIPKSDHVNGPKTHELISRIAEDRGIRNELHLLPNNSPGLSYVWRAMEWAKPNGQIALALHDGLLFQQSDDMAAARQAIFNAIDITGVVNGADLGETNIWPEIDTSFFLLFARNMRPGPTSAFRFVNLPRELPLNTSGYVRLDALNADLVTREQLLKTPEIFKTLFRGSAEDLELIEKLRGNDNAMIDGYWSREINVSAKGDLQTTGIDQYHALVRGSGLAAWWALMTDESFGANHSFSREKQITLKQMPVPDFDELDDLKLREFDSLFNGIMDRTRTWDHVDQWVMALYDIVDHDVQVIDDTLKFNLPFKVNRCLAEHPPSAAMQNDFCTALHKDLLHWCERSGTDINVQAVSVPSISPWRCIEISNDGDKKTVTGLREKFRELACSASNLAASEMDLPVGPNCLLHVRRAEARYWTETQACLFAGHIIWHHLDLLDSGKPDDTKPSSATEFGNTF